MNVKPKHEKVIIPKGRLQIFKKVIANLKKEDKDFKMLMNALPPIQKLRSHSYCYVPVEYAHRIKDIYEELHFEMYGS